jgi:uncharacterized protein YbjT (DUF2867 family)
LLALLDSFSSALRPHYRQHPYADVPHFAGKHTAERMIEDLDLPATILRPAYFIQNDLSLKEPLLNSGVYGMPIGSKGISMVDIRDIGEAAAIEMVRRERAAAPLGREIYALVGPNSLTGEDITAIWSEALPARSVMAATILTHWSSISRPCCLPGTFSTCV